jgi:ABC-type nitrate/sulfonate/bicarbonate transport system permease component
MEALASQRPTQSARRRLLGPGWPGRLADLALGIIGLGVIIGGWWLLSTQMQAVQLPAPDVVWDAMWNNLWEMPALTYATFQSGGIADGLLYTTENVFIGVGLGLAFGIATGLLMGRVRVADGLLEAPLVVLGTVPVLIMLPFIVTWFGTARLAQTGLVIFFTFVTIAADVRNAVRNVAGSYEQSAMALGASQSVVLREVVLPAIVPEVLGAVRVCFAAGWGFEAIAEILGAQHGIGRIIQTMGTQSATPELMASVLWLAIVAVVVDGLLVLAGKWAVRWSE